MAIDMNSMCEMNSMCKMAAHCNCCCVRWKKGEQMAKMFMHNAPQIDVAVVLPLQKTTHFLTMTQALIPLAGMRCIYYIVVS